jgi:hypothetical protein
MSAVERQKVLGHSDAEMTLRYSHAQVENMRTGIEQIDQRISGGRSGPGKTPAGIVIEFDFAARADSA